MFYDIAIHFATDGGHFFYFFNSTKQRDYYIHRLSTDITLIHPNMSGGSFPSPDRQYQFLFHFIVEVNNLIVLIASAPSYLTNYDTVQPVTFNVLRYFHKNGLLNPSFVGFLDELLVHDFWPSQTLVYSVDGSPMLYLEEAQISKRWQTNYIWCSTTRTYLCPSVDGTLAEADDTTHTQFAVGTHFVFKRTDTQYNVWRFDEDNADPPAITGELTVAFGASTGFPVLGRDHSLAYVLLQESNTKKYEVRAVIDQGYVFGPYGYPFFVLC